MKTRLLIIIGIIGISGLLVHSAFGVTEELIYGNSSIELLPSEIIPGKPTSFEIKFQYTEGPYALDNFIPIIEINPASTRSHVTIDVSSTDVTNRQIVRIPVTLTVDPQIESEKIFLSISFTGDHFSSRSDTIYKSAWIESAILNISSKEFTLTELPSSQDYEFETMTGARCDGELSLCYGTFANGTTISIQCDYRHSCGVVPFNDSDIFYQSPLKQIKSGIYGNDIDCREERILVLKKSSELYSCITPDTVPKLFSRGWALNEVRIIDTDRAEQGKLIKITGIIDRLLTPEGFEYHLVPLREELPRIEYTGYDTLNLFSTEKTAYHFLRNFEGKLVKIEGKFLLDDGEYFRHFSGFPTIPVEKMELISDNENLDYSITGAKVLSIVKIPDNAILNIVIQESQKGSLEISIPRDLFDVKIGGYDDDFFVLVDGIEVAFDEKRNDVERRLTIQFEANTTTIQVIGTFLI